MQNRIPTPILEMEVTGPGVSPQRLDEAISGGPTLLVFLRHFG